MEFSESEENLISYIRTEVAQRNKLFFESWASFSSSTIFLYSQTADCTPQPQNLFVRNNLYIIF